MTDGHWPPGRSQTWLSGRIEAFQHLGRGKFCNQLARWLLERDLAALDELHRRCRRYGFFGESEKFRALAYPMRRQAGAMPPSLGHS